MATMMTVSEINAIADPDAALCRAIISQAIQDVATFKRLYEYYSASLPRNKSQARNLREAAVNSVSAKDFLGSIEKRGINDRHLTSML